jgi:hypothetical protein
MPLKVVSVFGHASVAITGYIYRHVRVQTVPGGADSAQRCTLSSKKVVKEGG